MYNVLAQLISKDGAHPIVFSFYRDIAATPILFAGAWYFDGGVRIPRQEDVPRIVAQGWCRDGALFFSIYAGGAPLLARV